MMTAIKSPVPAIIYSAAVMIVAFKRIWKL
jgi:hypothetical protein